MSRLTINAFPTTANIHASFGGLTVDQIGSVTIDATEGTVVEYAITADQCTTQEGSFTVTTDETKEIILTYIGSVSVDTWVPATGKATFPTHIAMLGKGGWREVANIAERDAIPSARREAGMAVYITGTHKLFILDSDLVNWTEFSAGGGNFIRKSDELYTLKPMYPEEIVQYIGETNEEFINGYFYRAELQKYTIDNSENPEAFVRVDDKDLFESFLDDLKTQYGEDAQYIKFESVDGINRLVYSSLDTENPCLLPGQSEPGQINCELLIDLIGVEFNGDYEHSPAGTSIYIRMDGTSYAWEQANVQNPADEVFWGNVSGDISDQEDLQAALDQKVDHYKLFPEASEDYLDHIAQYIGDTNEDFINGYFYKCVEDTDFDESGEESGETSYKWIQWNVQPDFSVIDRVRRVEVLPTDPEQKNEIVQYIGTTNSTYTKGFFYINEDEKVEDTADLVYSHGSTLTNIELDINQFGTAVDHESGNYLFTYDPEIGGWYYIIDDAPIVFDIADFGITYEGQPAVDDVIEVRNYVYHSETRNIWKQTNVQPEPIVDSVVTEDSPNLITSGAVFDAIKTAQPTYTAEEGATVSVGGFNVGDKPENMTFQDFADTLLHKYVNPSISATISPDTATYQLGTTVNVTMLATVTRNAPSKYPLTSLSFYSEDVEKEKITDGINVKTGTWSYTFENVGATENTKYYVENLRATAADATKSASATKNIAFIAPTFYGKVSVPTAIEEAGQTQQYIQNNIETIIEGCTSKLTAENVTYNCNLAVEHYIFITPFTVTQITDTVTQFKYLDSTSSFDYSRTDNGVTTAYKVYYLTHQATGNGYKFQFTVAVTEG